MELEETNHRFWETSFIIASATGMPFFLAGAVLTNTYGSTVAFTAILMGNLILWFIGLGIVMMNDNRNNSVQNIKEYLGNFSGIFSSLVLVFAFVLWYTMEIKVYTDIVVSLIQPWYGINSNTGLRIGTVLGLICALLSLGGIKLIKYISIIALPPMVIFIAYLALKYGNFHGMYPYRWSFSAHATLYVILLRLPATVNLSTFFRHSRSKVDSIFGLTLIMFFYNALQIPSVFVDIKQLIHVFNNYSNIPIYYLVIYSAFLFLSFTAINLANIYWASAGWEAIFKRQRHGPKEYAIIGLLGTSLYALLQVSYIMTLLEEICLVCLGSLCFALLTGFLIKKLVCHRPRLLEKLIGTVCWCCGSIIGISRLIYSGDSPIQSTMIGITFTLLTFLLIVFLEELVWVCKKPSK